MSDRRELLDALGEAVATFVEVGQGVDPAIRVNREWTAKDTAAHIAFWHESFARNLSDAAAGRAPRPLRGTYAQLNNPVHEGDEAALDGEIIERLLDAHEVVRDGITDPSFGAIPYRRGSRDYSPEEHLEVVAAHVQSHATRIRKVGMPDA